MDDALTLLRLQVEWGADEALLDDPIDRLRPIEAPAPPPVARPVAVAEPPAGTPAQRALAAASAAVSIDALRAALAAFDGCALRDTASNLVFAEGNPAAHTIVIGEPPGREEDRGGHPFAGAEGLLLDQMLATIGLARAELMLTPLIPWRPPGGRPVNPGELALCLPFLHRLIALLKPARIVLFGGSAARALLPGTLPRRRAAVAWVDFRMADTSQTLPCIALPSLADLIKTPALRRDAWIGLRLLRRAIDET